MTRIIAILLAVSVLASSALPAANSQEFNQGNPECINADASTGLLEAAAEVAELSTLVAAVKAADATDAFEDTSSKVTAFAPTNGAFEAVLSDLGLKTVDELLASPLLPEILRYHVVGDPHTADYFVDGVELPTREGDSLQGYGETIIVAANGNATIIEADVYTCQGIVEVVDKVMLPPTVVNILGERSNETAGNSSTAVIGGPAVAGEGGGGGGGGGGVSDDSEEGSNGRHPCTACPEECVAAPGFTESNGITDALCSQCAEGYLYWPCGGDDAPSGGCICAVDPDFGQCPSGQFKNETTGECQTLPPVLSPGNPLPSVCDLGQVLIDGECVDCPDGQVPNENGDGCEALDPDFGQCPSGQFKNETTGECQTLPPVLSPGNPLPSVCDLGQVLIDGECVDCPDGQVPNENGDGCEALDPDFGQCPSGQFKNETTGECQTLPPVLSPGNPLPSVCDLGQVLIDGECVDCPDGQVPNENGDGCEALDPDFGQCPSGQFKNETTGECQTLPPVLSPGNPLPSVCDLGQVLIDGECVDCPDGQVPNENGDGCEALDPDFGQCPSGQFKNETTGECQTLPPVLSPGNPLPSVCDLGQVLIDGECVDCPDGQVPNENGDGCEACEPNQYANQLTNTCEDCPEGKVPVYPPSDTYRAENSSLEGSTFNSEFEMCKCPDGQIESGSGQCKDCPDGQVPNESGDGCESDTPTGEKGTWCPIPCWEEDGNPPITHKWCEDNCDPHGTGQLHAACSADGNLNVHQRCQDCSTIKPPPLTDCNRSKNEALNATESSSDDGTMECKDPRGCSNEDPMETPLSGTLDMPTLPGSTEMDPNEAPVAGTLDMPTDPKDEPAETPSAPTLNLGGPSLPGDASGFDDAGEEPGLLGKSAEPNDSSLMGGLAEERALGSSGCSGRSGWPRRRSSRQGGFRPSHRRARGHAPATERRGHARDDSPLDLSPVGLGTMLFGTSTGEEEAFAMLDRARDHGINLLDTAEMYPVPQSAESQGRSEAIVGKWLRSRTSRGGDVRREDVVVATKVTGPSGQMPWIRGGPPRVDARAIREACEGSLRRLQVDCIDIYQVHWPDRYVPMFGETLYDASRRYASVSLEEQMDALGSLVEEGKVRRIGLSNETPWGLTKCCNLHAASASGGEMSRYPRIHYLQNAYNLLCRSFDASLAECCAEERVSLLAYSPLAMGLLTGKYHDGRGGPPSARLNLYRGRYSEAEQRYERTPRVMEAVRRYVTLAGRHDMTCTELAIRFAASCDHLGSVVVGATSCDQFDEVAAYARKGRLGEAVLKEIDLIHRDLGSPAP